MQGRKHKKLLSLLLTLFMVLTMLPMTTVHVHADFEDGQDCIYCGAYRYDDWLCDGCGGCSENADGGDCYADHHCPECGDCEDSGLDHCGNCMRCEECVDICSECELCIDCGAYGIEYICGSCGKCASCATGSICFECGECDSCHGGNQCASDDCRKCANCYEARCPECELCNECLGDLYCPDCWICVFCVGGDACIGCYRDRNCTILCSNCGEYCTECADEFCDECELCSQCTGFLDCCGACLNCAEYAGLQFCADCGRCEDCSEGFCSGCGLCSECAFICTGCGVYCSECADAFCYDCHLCAECTTICSDCQSICAECASDFCDTCQKCDDCVIICPGCGEYCNECGDLCGSCGYCENCAEICVSCGYFCSECSIICPDCGQCAENCTLICLGCFDTCIDCADEFCEDCQLCDACTEICPECGQACSECTAFCAGCGVCGNCETICENCGAYCSACALICPYHHECEYCIDICVTCETYCEYDALICFACGECEVCTDLYSRPDYDKHDHWFTCTCGQIHNRESHYWEGWTIHEPATATQHGVKSRTCRECAYTAHEIIPASHEHIPSEWIPDTPATETTDGSKYKICMLCNEVLETGIIPATGTGHTHAWGSIWEHDNTNHWRSCDCGKKYFVSAHYTGDWIIDAEPTEITEGSRHRACLVCGYITDVDTIPAIGSVHKHDWIDAWFRDETGHWHGCACGAEKDKAAHIAGGWIADIAATETTDGSRHKECLVCGHIMETSTIPATGPNHTHEWADTWSYDKTNHWYECSCGEKKDINVHTPGIWIVDIPASTTTEGSQHKECTVCGKTLETAVIPAKASSGGGSSHTNYTTKAEPLEEDKYNPGTGAYIPFDDVKINDWFVNPVMWAYENGLMLGTSTRTFSPNMETTRGMIVTILYRLEGSPKTGTGGFDDVADDKYYAGAVAWAADNKIVSGYGKGKFGPDDSLTREQLVTILYNYSTFKGYDTRVTKSLDSLADGASVSGYAKTAMEWAVENGIVTGIGADLLSPASIATRAQMAAILQRYIETIVE